MSVYVPYRAEHQKMAADLVKRAHAQNGLAPLDVERFWAEQEKAIQDPFGEDIAQVPLGAILTGECVYDELGVTEDHWRYLHDEEWRLALHRAYNDTAEKIVGRRILSEERSDPSRQYPPVKQLHDVFEARYEWHDQSWWLHQVVNSQDELSSLLDRVENRNIREFILPKNWEQEKQRLMAMGIRCPLYRSQRGPVTFAASIFGAENLIYLIMENPDLAARFRDVILKTMLEIARVLDEEAGYTEETAPHGFGFADDNCCLLTPEMYEFFGYPILKGIFDRYCPDPSDVRHQHSDSDMGHLLPILAKTGMNSVNFGPNVMIADIRRYMLRAVIRGQLAPFTYSRNEEENIVMEFLRDFEMARESRGIIFDTAGSINNGTRLTSMRLVMAAIQKYGRYDR